MSPILLTWSKANLRTAAKRIYDDFDKGNLLDQNAYYVDFKNNLAALDADLKQFKNNLAALDADLKQAIAGLLSDFSEQTDFTKTFLSRMSYDYQLVMVVYGLYEEKRPECPGAIENHHPCPKSLGGALPFVVPLPFCVHVWAHVQLHQQIGGPEMALSLKMMAPSSPQLLDTSQLPDLVGSIAKARMDAAEQIAERMLGNTNAAGDQRCGYCGMLGHKIQTCYTKPLPPGWRLAQTSDMQPQRGGAGRPRNEEKTLARGRVPVRPYFVPGYLNPSSRATYVRWDLREPLFAPTRQAIEAWDNWLAGQPDAPTADGASSSADAADDVQQPPRKVAKPTPPPKRAPPPEESDFVHLLLATSQLPRHLLYFAPIRAAATWDEIVATYRGCFDEDVSTAVWESGGARTRVFDDASLAAAKAAFVAAADDSTSMTLRSWSDEESRAAEVNVD